MTMRRAASAAYGRGARSSSPAALCIPTRPSLARRWRELPDAARTPPQLLGRRTLGCEDTHGVFPRCNLACTPCVLWKDLSAHLVFGFGTATPFRAMAGAENAKV